MTTPIFKKKTRVDKVIANEGVWTKIYDDTGDYYGNIKIRFFDTTSERVRNSAKRFKALHNKYKAQDEERLANIVYNIEMMIVDWKDIEGGDGENVPFSIESAIAYFTDEDNMWIMQYIENVAMSSANFKTDEIEKNSEPASTGAKAK